MKWFNKVLYMAILNVTMPSNAMFKEPTEFVVIKIPDGVGLCDQMYFYALGTSIEKKGYPVKYHVPCCESERFQLLKAFPYLNFKMVTTTEANRHRCFVVSHLENYETCLNCRPPSYIRKTCCHDRLIDYSKYFSFKENILDDVNLKILQKIRSLICPIGVHVRRGDMASPQGYIFVPPVDYFVKATRKAKELFPDAYFFFFSDEPNYVKQNILLQLDANIKYEAVDVNDFSKGYMDMFLMSECKHQIRSQGSMGEMSYILNKYSQKKLIAPKKCRKDVTVTPDFEI
ncbi:MAG: alpha-1,2-fucosyltransferase [Holosporaceae bacterium]|jgi:hypothetical protein|nr:alpha-1,2-fucosyltransferase [Holosporaceae bacterium]